MTYCLDGDRTVLKKEGLYSSTLIEISVIGSSSEGEMLMLDGTSPAITHVELESNNKTVSVLRLTIRWELKIIKTVINVYKTPLKIAI